MLGILFFMEPYLSDEKERFPVLQRETILEHYYAGTIYGKLHIWTHKKIASNGWFEFHWWDNINNDIVVDMKRNLFDWKQYREFTKTHDRGLKWKDKERGAELWWTAHNGSLSRARERYERYFRLMPYIVQERTGLMIEGAIAWKIDGLRPWKAPAKWMQIFM